MSLTKPLASGLSGLSAINPQGGADGGGPGFSWGDYPGLVFRYDVSANTENHMTVVNSLVTSVKDQTGNDNHAVQANTSLQPAVTTLTGSLTGIQGNAVAFLATGALLSPDPKTIFIVVKAPEGSTVRHFSGASQSRLGITAADARFMRAGTQLADGAYTANTLEIWLAEFNSTASLLYVNGGAAVASGNAGTGTDSAVTLLSLATGTQATDGSIGEYARFNRVLTTTEKNEIGSALGTKWGLSWTTIT
jgi:hypothetical protein